MQTIEVAHRPFHPAGKMDHAPVVAGYDGDVRFVDPDGNTVAVQIMEALDNDRRTELARVLRYAISWSDASKSYASQARLSGIRYPLRTFGFTEPKPLRRRYGCAASSFYEDHPATAALLDDVSGEWWKLLQEHVPAVAERQLEVMAAIHPDWWLGGAPWTSGIINKTSALSYHRDAGNLKNTWSVMLTLRRHMNGGALYLPEWDFAFAVPDGSLIMFEGQTYWHGVTPFHPTRADAWRYTLVWYAKAGIRSCGCRADEAHRAAVRATAARDT